MTASASAPLPPRSKAEWVFDTLLREIRAGKLRPGEPLRVDEIARRLGVSSTPVREALRLLAAQRAADIIPHRGARVAASMSPADLEILYRMRVELESLAAELVATHGDPDAVQSITQAHRALASAAGQRRSAARLAELNRLFHFAVFDASSPLVASTIRGLWDLIPGTMRNSLWHDADNVSTFLGAHEAILDAIVAHDSELAAQLMAEHARDAFARRSAEVDSAPAAASLPTARRRR